MQNLWKIKLSMLKFAQWEGFLQKLSENEAEAQDG